MAKEINIGINGVARKVPDIYIGINGVARKVTEGYIGINGVAQPFYTADNGVYTSFSSSILPTTWTLVAANEITGTNEYGTWHIKANSWYGKEWGTQVGSIDLAFDGNINTYSQSSNYSNDYTVTITCPAGVTICPTRFSITEYRMGADEDGNTITGDGVVLVNFGEDFYDIDEPKTKTYSATNSQYFSKIKLTMTSHKNGYIRQLYNFEITRGTIRVEK